MTYQKIFEFSTSGRGTSDITNAVAGIVAEADVQTGIVQVFVQHTSCSVTITENADADVRYDLETVLARSAPDGDPAYRHRIEGRDDMAAHARSVLTGTSVSVPFGGGRLLLGVWQGIYLWEHRTSPQRRSVVVTVLGH